MDILNKKYRIVGLAPQKGKATVVVRLNGSYQEIDLIAISEKQAAVLVKAGCRFIEKVEAKEKPKSSSSKTKEAKEV